MGTRIQLNDKQEALLRWIADGCPDGVMRGTTHRISAAALRNRGLARTTGRGASWAAELTPAGREHLSYLNSREARSRGLVMATAASRQYAGFVHAQSSFGSATDERHHHVTREYRQRTDRHEVSRNQIARAARLVEAIAIGAHERGWSIETASESENDFSLLDWTSAKDGHLQVEAGEQTFWIRIQEEGVRTRGAVDGDQSLLGRGNGSAGGYDANATGRLKLELRWGAWFTRQQRRWVDRASATVEEQIPELMAAMEQRLEDARCAASQKQQQAQQAAAEERAVRERRELEWLALMDQARREFAASRRAQRLIDQASDWERANLLRRYCEAMAISHGEDRRTGAWLQWARGYADELDPLTAAPQGPSDLSPTPEQLQQYLPEGWSSRGP